jgi:hypothetical protein
VGEDSLPCVFESSDRKILVQMKEKNDAFKAHWLVSSAMRLSSTAPLATRWRASSTTAVQGLERNLPL